MGNQKPTHRVLQADAALLDKLQVALNTARELIKNGLSIQDVQVGALGDPQIQLLYNHRCQRLGGYVHHHVNAPGGQYRQWVAKYGPVRLTWHQPVEAKA